MGRYYFDTSIWLDFFEDRNEPNMPKGEWAHSLLNKIVENNDKIIVSDHSLLELAAVGYQSWEIEEMFRPLRQFLIFVEATMKEMGKAKDLSKKRDVPRGDALHALIARDNRAIVVTLDRHFQKLLDIAETKRPQDLI